MKTLIKDKFFGLVKNSFILIKQSSIGSKTFYYANKYFEFSNSDAFRKEGLIIRLLLLALVFFILWASLFSIRQVVHARGQVIAVAKTQLIQSPDGGILTNINVKEGDFVKKGQLLADLDKDRLEAVYNETDAKVFSLKIAKQRLNSLISNKPFVVENIVTEKYNDILKEQQSLYNRQKQSYFDQKVVLDANLKIAKSDYQMNQKLEKYGDISHSEVLKSLKTLNDATGALSQFDNKFHQDLITELAKLNEDLEINNQILLEKAEMLEHANFVSPVDGLVKNIKVTTIGGFLRSGDTLMEILPVDSEFIIEAKLNPSNISFVKPGQPVNIKLDSYDYSIFGSLQGVLDYISPDSISEQNTTNNDQNIYYRVKVKILNPDRSLNNEISITPGMTASLDIDTGSRRVISLLLRPLVKTFSESFSR